MSPKELLYIEDALGHEQFSITQCKNAAENLQDPQLREYVKNMMSKHQQAFGQFYQLV